jgi:hypothetical protein
VSIGIPILSNLYINNTRSGFTLSDVIQSVDADGLLNLNTFHGKLKGDGITIQTTIHTDLFHVSFPIGKFQIGINSSFKNQNTQFISKELIGFLSEGNAYFAGQTVDINLLDLNTIAYLENGISISRQFSKFSVGGRFKYLQGIASIESKGLGFSITTSKNPFDPLTLRTKGTFRTSGIPLVLVDSLTGEKKDDKLKEFNTSDLTKFSNSGYGIDFGATYNVTSKMMVHGSVIDWGGINWNSTPYNYEFTGKPVTFSGFTREDFNSDSTRNALTDSLAKQLQEATVTSKSFNTKLLTRYYAGVDYSLTSHDRVGFLFQGQQLPSTFVSALTFSYARKFGTNWDLSANYTRFNNATSMVGVGTAIKMGPVQLYLITDDILILFNPQNYNALYFRMGINLVWSQNTGKHISSGE